MQGDRSQKSKPTIAGSTESAQRGAAPPSDRAGSIEAQMLHLQRTIGNQALHLLLDGARPPAPLERVIQRDFLGDARTAVGHGTTTVVTNQMARTALEALAKVPSADLAAVMAQFDDSDLQRMIDKLLPFMKKDQKYTRVLVGLSTARRAPYMDFLVTAGNFFWVDLPADASLLLTSMTGISTAQVGGLLEKVDGCARLDRLIKAASSAHHSGVILPWAATLPKGEALSAGQKALLKKVFDATADTEFATLQACMNHRFDLLVGQSTSATGQGETPIDWEAGGLRRMWPVLAALPVNHVVRNRMLISMGRYAGGGSAGGYYEQAGRESAMSYGADQLTSANQAADPGDPLHGVNRFDKVVRHEVGHAVDADMGWTAGAEPAKASRGGWTQYGADATRCVTDMVTTADAFVNKLEPAKRTQMITALATVMGNRTTASLGPVVGAACPWIRSLSALDIAALNADPVIRAVQDAVSDPWYTKPGGGPHIGDHIYEESYPGQWNRYRHDSRARKVSLYQFRAPGEWFAEVYATYYEPDPKGKGAKLATVDTDSKKYFDEHIDKRAASR